MVFRSCFLNLKVLVKFDNSNFFFPPENLQVCRECTIYAQVSDDFFYLASQVCMCSGPLTFFIQFFPLDFYPYLLLFWPLFFLPVFWGKKTLWYDFNQRILTEKQRIPRLERILTLILEFFKRSHNSNFISRFLELWE